MFSVTHHRPAPIYRELHSMFRTALLRSARSAARAAPRCKASMARPALRSSLLQPRQTTPSPYFQAVRCYAASAGLSQPEVLGRIMDLLKNFDKVMGTRRRNGAIADALTGPGRLKGTCKRLPQLMVPMLTLDCSSTPNRTSTTILAWTVSTL